MSNFADSMKLSVIYNFSQKYREGIFRLIDQEYDCDWYFGNNDTDIKGMDTSLLSHVTTIRNQRLLGPWYYQHGVRQQVSRYNHFLVLGELYCLSTWLLLLLCYFRKNKTVTLWSHGWYGREGFLKKWLKRCYFSLADNVLLYGDYARRVARQQGFSKDNLGVIHNSLNYYSNIRIREQLRPTSIYKDHFGNAFPTLIFIGRLAESKQLDRLIDAVARLNGRGEHCNLVLVGGGSILPDLEKQAAEMGVKDRVWFYGACYDELKNSELIYNADLCVSPGNVGLTAIHTMTYGTPVATHDNFPMQGPEFEAITEGVTGTFFAYNNTDSIVESISRWLKKHSSDREDVRRACYEVVDKEWNPEYQINVLRNTEL